MSCHYCRDDEWKCPDHHPTPQGPVYVNPLSNGGRCLVCDTYFPSLLQECPVCDINSRDVLEIEAESRE